MPISTASGVWLGRRTGIRRLILGRHILVTPRVSVGEAGVEEEARR